jgi:hypothetical protein
MKRGTDATLLPGFSAGAGAGRVPNQLVERHYPDFLAARA